MRNLIAQKKCKNSENVARLLNFDISNNNGDNNNNNNNDTNNNNGNTLPKC